LSDESGGRWRDKPGIAPFEPGDLSRKIYHESTKVRKREKENAASDQVKRETGILVFFVLS
jgi:hypothetical protein